MRQNFAWQVFERRELAVNVAGALRRAVSSSSPYANAADGTAERACYFTADRELTANNAVFAIRRYSEENPGERLVRLLPDRLPAT